MNKKVMTRTLAVSLAMIATLSLFNNCGQDLPSEAQTFASESDPASSPGSGAGPNGLTALDATLNPATIFVDQTSQVLATGGQAPYTFSIVSGTAGINQTGAITGPLAVGSVIVQISDRANQSRQVVLTVNARPVAPAPGTPPAPTLLSCPAPFGPSIPHGGTLTAFQTATIYCPSTAMCASQTRVCNNGTLSGTYTASSCSTRACVYKATEYATDRVSGNMICQISMNDNGTVGGLPQVSSASMLPTSCTNSQFNTSQICEVAIGYTGSGDSGTETYSFTKFTCRGANETISPILVNAQPYTGGGSN